MTLAVVLERIRMFGYTWADHEKIVEGLPVFKLRIPFEVQIRNLFRIRPLLVIGIMILILGVIFFIAAGTNPDMIVNHIPAFLTDGKEKEGYAASNIPQQNTSTFMAEKA